MNKIKRMANKSRKMIIKMKMVWFRNRVITVLIDLTAPSWMVDGR
jgi:hypothetical protein